MTGTAGKTNTEKAQSQYRDGMAGVRAAPRLSLGPGHRGPGQSNDPCKPMQEPTISARVVPGDVFVFDLHAHVSTHTRMLLPGSRSPTWSPSLMSLTPLPQCFVCTRPQFVCACMCFTRIV
eukprot:2985481-Rhodomonas_salina.1